MSGWRTTQNQTAVIHIQNLARLPQEPHQAADRQHPGVPDAGPLLGRLHAGHLRPRHHRRPAQSRPDDGQYPLLCRLMLSAARSRWGQRLGQKKAAGESNNLCKQKDPKPYGFGSFWHAVRDSNPGLLVRRLSQAQIGAASAPICAFYRRSLGGFSIVSVQPCPLRFRSGSKLGQGATLHKLIEYDKISQK